MAQRVFISFLGLGYGKPPHTAPGYDEVAYRFADGAPVTTRFSQRAIIEHLGADTFDRIILLMTPQSQERHYALLRDELLALGVSPDRIRDDLNDLNADQQGTTDQWRWFSAVLDAIQPEDDVVFDFTHGFRSVPIILSTAISFLQKIRPFRLLHAYYGYVVQGSRDGEIIDMAPFYEINRWADAVSALVQSADTGPLVTLANTADTQAFPALRDDALTRSLQDLTRAIKDVDMNHVAHRADTALQTVRAHLHRCEGEAERRLLELVIDKFAQLGEQVGSGRYDQPYFDVQSILIKTLLQHGMHMQAYTVMRETIASIGMLGAHSKYINKTRDSSDGRKARRRFGELFVTLCNYPRSDWKYAKNPPDCSEEQRRDYEALLPFWETLEGLALAAPLHTLTAEMTQIRNGLDHGWTAQKEAQTDISERAEHHLGRLRGVLERLTAAGMIPG